MRRLHNAALIGLLCAVSFAPQLEAQQNGAPKNGATAARHNDAPIIDPDALDALRKMGEYLRTLDQFQVKAAITHEEVLLDSQKVQFAKKVDLVVDRPGHFRMQVKGDQHERLLVYDGKTFSIFAPRTKYYATVAAPPNIAELAKKLEDDFDLELPLVDLFRWGTGDALTSDITAAKNIGPSDCDGLTCQHYTFRQAGLDWQVWIQKGEFPLPRKIVLTTLTDEARPQYTAVYNWNLAPSFDQEAFAFVPPADAKKIPLADVPRKPTVGQK
jgi:hypothetical protein